MLLLAHERRVLCVISFPSGILYVLTYFLQRTSGRGGHGNLMKGEKEKKPKAKKKGKKKKAESLNSTPRQSSDILNIARSRSSFSASVVSLALSTRSVSP